MSKEKYKELFEELYSCMGEYGNEGTALELMKIDRLDRIADALENIDQSLQCLAGCIGPMGSFCIALDTTSQDC